MSSLNPQEPKFTTTTTMMIVVYSVIPSYIVFTCRALLVQGQAVSVGGNGNDASVPESDVKRIRI